MPRNSSGNFVLPVGNPVSPNTVIESGWANVTMDDLAQGITDSLDRNGRGGMLAPFRLADGTLTAPGLGFLAEPSMGIRRAGTKHMEAVMSGIIRQQWLDDHVAFPQEVRAQASAVITGTVTGTAVTQSNIDATTGRLLKVGDFGLASVTPPAITDFNTVARTGFYTATSAAVNAPVPGRFWSLLHQQFDTSGAQIAMRAGVEAQEVWARSSSLGTWGAWLQVNVGPIDLSPYMQKAQNLNDVADKSASRSNLGLGTAAVQNITTSTTDMINVVSTRGWMGLGSMSVQLSNFNNPPIGNAYIMGTSGGPIEGNWYVGKNIIHNSGWLTQEVWSFVDSNTALPARFYRATNGGGVGTFGPWLDMRTGGDWAYNVGKYVWCGSTSAFGVGQIVAGSTLSAAGLGSTATACNANSANNANVQYRSCDTLPGTWRAQGTPAGAVIQYSLFQRIA
jgi:hypothetical protein